MKNHSFIYPAFILVALAGAIALPVLAATDGNEVAEEIILDAEIVHQSTVVRGESKVTFRRIAPPHLPVRSSPKAPSAPASTDADDFDGQQERRPQETLLIEATVFDSGVSKLRWHYNGLMYSGWSSIDFHALDGFLEIETPEGYISFLFLTLHAADFGHHGEEAAFGAPPVDWFPAKGSFLPINAPESERNPAAGYWPMEVLHEHYRENHREIHERHADRVAAQAFREANASAEPVQERETVIYFWPKKSRRYDTTP